MNLLEQLPRDLQHQVLLEWLVPNAVHVVAGVSAKILESVKTAPREYRVVRCYFLSKECVDWFRDQNIALQLWTNSSYCEFVGEQHWRNGVPHRDDDKPAYVGVCGAQMWFQDGERHRDGDKPAIIYADGTQVWCQHNKMHRDGNKPYMVYSDGTQVFHRGGDSTIVRVDGTTIRV